MNARGVGLRPGARLCASVVLVFGLLAACGSDDGGGEAAGTGDPDQRAVDLTREGDTLTFRATDAHGEWATITLTRGRDVDHYPGHLPLTPGATYSEVFTRYEITADRPQRPFGITDWWVRFGDVPRYRDGAAPPITTAPQPFLGSRLHAERGRVVEGWIYVEIGPDVQDQAAWLAFDPVPAIDAGPQPEVNRQTVDFEVLLRP